MKIKFFTCAVASCTVLVGSLAACTDTTTTIFPSPGGDASTAGDANLGSDGSTTEQDGSSTSIDGSTGRDGSTTPADGGVRPDASTSSCYNGANGMTFSSAPPQAGQNVCNSAALNSFWSACLGTAASSTTCNAFIASNKTCVRCLLGPQPGDTPAAVPQPLLFSVGSSIHINLEACEQLAVGAPTSCATKAGNASLCVLSTCEACDPLDRDACLNDSSGRDPCLSAAPDASCVTKVTAGRATADLKCGATVGATFEDVYRKAGAFICGAP